MTCYVIKKPDGEIDYFTFSTTRSGAEYAMASKKYGAGFQEYYGYDQKQVKKDWKKLYIAGYRVVRCELVEKEELVDLPL